MVLYVVDCIDVLVSSPERVKPSNDDADQVETFLTVEPSMMLLWSWEKRNNGRWLKSMLSRNLGVVVWKDVIVMKQR